MIGRNRLSFVSEVSRIRNLNSKDKTHLTLSLFSTTFAGGNRNDETVIQGQLLLLSIVHVSLRTDLPQDVRTIKPPPRRIEQAPCAVCEHLARWVIASGAIAGADEGWQPVSSNAVVVWSGLPLPGPSPAPRLATASAAPAEAAACLKPPTSAVSAGALHEGKGITATTTVRTVTATADYSQDHDDKSNNSNDNNSKRTVSNGSTRTRTIIDRAGQQKADGTQGTTTSTTAIANINTTTNSSIISITNTVTSADGTSITGPIIATLNTRRTITTSTTTASATRPVPSDGAGIAAGNNPDCSPFTGGYFWCQPGPGCWQWSPLTSSVSVSSAKNNRLWSYCNDDSRRNRHRQDSQNHHETDRTSNSNFKGLSFERSLPFDANDDSGRRSTAVLTKTRDGWPLSLASASAETHTTKTAPPATVTRTITIGTTAALGTTFTHGFRRELSLFC